MPATKSPPKTKPSKKTEKKESSKHEKTEKKTKASGDWRVWKTSRFLHWLSKGDSGSISIRKLAVTAGSTEQSAALSLAADLMLGKGPSTLQSAFDKAVAANTKEFLAANPNYEFRIGGREPH